MKNCIFDTTFGMSSNKEKTPLKHANQFALFLAKVWCPTILTNIDFDVLKTVIWMLVITGTVSR